MSTLMGQMEWEHGWELTSDSAHQEEGESSKANTSSSKQSGLHGRVLAQLSGTVRELTEPLLQEKQKQKHSSAG